MMRGPAAPSVADHRIISIAMEVGRGFAVIRSHGRVGPVDRVNWISEMK